MVGSGPAGLYAADLLVREDERVHVDVFDRMPTPYGLVRYGVAPDHPRIKTVVRSLEKILEHPRVRFLGNTEVGIDIDAPFIERHYDAVVYATGASTDRRLGVPGEGLRGSYSATQFVSWYSAHPDHPESFDLRGSSAAVIGAGNVALDVGRMLSKSRADLSATEIPDQVLEQLERSTIREVHIVCRRGPEHSKFTAKELQELLELADVDVHVDPRDVEAADEDGLPPGVRSNLSTFRTLSERPARGCGRSIRFHFWKRPIEIVGGEQVSELVLEGTQLAPDGSLRGTGERESLPTQLVLRSVGYRSSPLGWVPFDERTGTIPNDGGRIVDGGGRVVRGQYVSGWAKRGPSGVIGTNRLDSSETVKNLLSDLPDLISDEPRRRQSLDGALAELRLRDVSYDGWRGIDAEEIRRGASQGRTRTKIPDWESLRHHGWAATGPRKHEKERI